MKIYLAIGLICLLSVSVFAESWVTPRDDNRVPASVVVDKDGNFLVIHTDGSMYVIASTNSKVGIYYEGNTAIVDSKGQLYVRVSTNSTVRLTDAQINSLKNVWITSGTISTLEVISQLNELRNIWISSGIISTLEVISQLNELRNIWVSSGIITTVQNLSDLNDLMNVWITSGVITVDNFYDFLNIWITSGTISIDNFPADYPDSTLYEQLLSSVTTVEKKFLNKVSTGTSGKITSTTSQQIVISNNVTRFQFTFINSADGSAEATVTSSHDGGKMYFYDGFWKVISVDIPQPITFDVVMPVTSTFTYVISEVKQP